MLTQEYKYTLTKLYPETITDSKKQEKIFRELIASFRENTSRKPKKTIDTAKQELTEHKKRLQKLLEILQEEPPTESETLIPELKKLDQNNNITTIQQTIKDTLKKLSKERKNKTLFNKLRPIMKEVGIFVLPDIYFVLLEKIGHILETINPLFHPTKVTAQRHISHENVSQEVIEKEYGSIQSNKHIHIFLRKKYRLKTSDILKPRVKKYYIYTLLREKTSLFVSKKVLKNLQKIVFIALIVTIFVTCLAVFL
jgi:hypothetical protein